MLEGTFISSYLGYKDSALLRVSMKKEFGWFKLYIFQCIRKWRNTVSQRNVALCPETVSSFV